MMNEKQGIVKRTKMFALRIIRLYSSLPKTTEAQVIGKQVSALMRQLKAKFVSLIQHLGRRPNE